MYFNVRLSFNAADLRLSAEAEFDRQEEHRRAKKEMLSVENIEKGRASE